MKERYDVIVAGAGPSGVAAALAAARQGMEVLLIERSGILGGMNTAAMVGPLMGFHAGDVQVVRGIAQEIVDRLERRGGTLGHIPDPLGVASTITPIEPTALKQVYFEMLRERGNLDVLFHSFVDGAQTEGGSVQAVRCTGKSGRQEYRADVFIDATGDGDLAALAGAAFEQGRPSDGLAQPMSLLFKIGGVDFGAVRRSMAEYPGQFVLRDGWEKIGYVAVSGYFDAVERARRCGDLPLDRDRVLLFQGVRPDEAVVNMSRVARCRGTDAEQLSRAEAAARLQVDQIVAFLKKYVDGFADIRLVESGDCIGVRESRRIKGLYTLTAGDVTAGAAFADSVAVCAFPIDLHDPSSRGLQWVRAAEGSCYDVPYRVMVPEGFANLLVTGRCVSATHEAAASVRITPTAIALGEAAGLAAAQAAKADADVGAIDVGRLQRAILACGGLPGKRFLG